MIISATLVRRPRVKRRCGTCGKLIAAGPQVRLYGCAERGDPKYAMHLHPACVHPDAIRHEPQLRAVVDLYLAFMTKGGA